jgi:steroid delta-isomerase-like uncharacterized protein
VTAQASPTSRRHESVIRRYFDELFNEGRVQLAPELLAPDYVNHSAAPGLSPGGEGVVVVVQALRRAFPDLHYTIEEIVVGKGAVAARTAVTGTHHGDYFGLPPTGRAFRVSQITIERFRDDRIVADHRVTDELALMRRLGAVP